VNTAGNKYLRYPDPILCRLIFREMTHFLIKKTSILALCNVWFIMNATVEFDTCMYMSTYCMYVHTYMLKKHTYIHTYIHTNACTGRHSSGGWSSVRHRGGSVSVPGSSMWHWGRILAEKFRVSLPTMNCTYAPYSCIISNWYNRPIWGRSTQGLLGHPTLEKYHECIRRKKIIRNRKIVTYLQAGRWNGVNSSLIVTTLNARISSSTTTTNTNINNNNNNNNSSILYYLCAESTAVRPITDTAQCTCK
jgi:hypothetical protein